MSSGILTEDGSTPWHSVFQDDVHISVNSDFGSGTVAVEKLVEGNALPVFSAGVAITFTADDDSAYAFALGDKIRIKLSGSTSPNMIWSITGEASIQKL